MKTKKEFYVSPTIEVVEINGRSSILAGSGDAPDRGVQKMEEQYLFEETEP